jgi:hypothetical protein
MSTPATTIGADAPLRAAVRSLASAQLRQLCVVAAPAAARERAKRDYASIRGQLANAGHRGPRSLISQWRQAGLRY